ncbi:selenocysteine-specific translation elongation factor [Nocardioides ferulae]|uniref:selenocysteine-specific translation elongation factor n=1 Tax=Nocardioides ferulae TaxID=2340821 RepID=UPI000EB07CD6|nr:selenocysteine-specific translation elongation factor [Nocardioides ferulae]
MHVVATAGHVDHGKSTLVRALTGTDPDRLAEEKRRGLTIELGYAWTTLPDLPGLPSPGDVAFVDVPGHERFVPTMLAGVGPVPAVLFVVAADDPWMPQAAEHLAALDALGVRHGVVAVTRSDLADPGPAAARATGELAATGLAGAPVLPVSATTGLGLDELRSRLTEMVRRLPAPSPTADVRLWVDRRFTVRGAGTVVTGTLPAGTVRAGDSLDLLTPAGTAPVRVRAVQSLGEPVEQATGVARVAVNLTGDGVDTADRESVLLTPGAWHLTEVVDVRLSGDLDRPLPAGPVLHVGATSVAARTRPLDAARGLARLTLGRPLPLRVGDRALLRDPGSRRIWGVRVLDPAPPALRRRGAAAARAANLAAHTGAPDLADELRRRGLVDADLLRRLGVPTSDPPAGSVAAGGWWVGPHRVEEGARALAAAVRAHDDSHPLDPGLPVAVAAERIGLPAEVLPALVREPLRVHEGRVVVDGRGGLPADLVRAIAALEADLADGPFAAPTADRLRELGLDDRRAAAAARAGRLLRVAPGIVLLPDAAEVAAARLADLPQPFTISQARALLGTSRRVALPLLEHLDRRGLTRRLPDDRRELAG